MKKRNIYILSIIVVIVLIFIFTLVDFSESENKVVMVPVKYGVFQIEVTTTGELEAKSSDKIYGPSSGSLRNARIYQLRIEDIIPDGTVVDSGDYVARLDRSDLTNKIKDQEIDVEQGRSQFIKTQLDTTMELRNARNDLINLNFALEERQITVDQSKYEPPATQRQAVIDLDKSRRAYEQAVKNYDLRMEKAKAEMTDVAADLRSDENKLAQLMELKNHFMIIAPKSGMVNYKRGWDGKKQGVNSQISYWDPVIAILPNLKEMNSKTYINEIDISKIREGQKVEIGIDAFPEKHYTGNIIEIANMGEQMQNSNAKVFEVMIKVNEYDSILRPSMTTKNTIITDIIDSMLYIPIECIQNNDSMSYVFTSRNMKQIISGKSNENEIIIKAGLEKNEMIYLIHPEGAEDYKLIPLDSAIIKKYTIPPRDTSDKKEEKSKKMEKMSEQFKNMSSKDIQKMMKNKGRQGKKGGGGKRQKK
ncbi:MAG: HlyD family efflux transporter periplasmic adaptor subunit [Bacteroidales bacterium]|nr:HlyD family efflux transporter periplasmic adaptor subunit [Bacteroidales bacterium]